MDANYAAAQFAPVICNVMAKNRVAQWKII